MPNNNDEWIRLLNLGKYKEVIEESEQVIKLNPNCYLICGIRGIAFAGLNKYKEALKSYNHAIKLNPNHRGIVV